MKMNDADLLFLDLGRWAFYVLHNHALDEDVFFLEDLANDSRWFASTTVLWYNREVGQFSFDLEDFENSSQFDTWQKRQGELDNDRQQQ